MGCQKAIVEKVVGRGGHYVIGLKGNQPKFHAEFETQFQSGLKSNFSGTPVDWFEQSEKNRDRTEIPRVWCSDTLEQIP